MSLYQVRKRVFNHSKSMVCSNEVNNKIAAVGAYKCNIWKIYTNDIPVIDTGKFYKVFFHNKWYLIIWLNEDSKNKTITGEGWNDI